MQIFVQYCNGVMGVGLNNVVFVILVNILLVDIVDLVVRVQMIEGCGKGVLRW